MAQRCHGGVSVYYPLVACLLTMLDPTGRFTNRPDGRPLHGCRGREALRDGSRTAPTDRYGMNMSFATEAFLVARTVPADGVAMVRGAVPCWAVHEPPLRISAK